MKGLIDALKMLSHSQKLDFVVDIYGQTLKSNSPESYLGIYFGRRQCKLVILVYFVVLI